MAAGVQVLLDKVIMVLGVNTLTLGLLAAAAAKVLLVVRVIRLVTEVTVVLVLIGKALVHTTLEAAEAAVQTVLGDLVAPEGAAGPIAPQVLGRTAHRVQRTLAEAEVVHHKILLMALLEAQAS